MIDKGKLFDRINEEYETLVFQGYSVQEIAYMGTCLIRLAIMRKMVTKAELVPELEPGMI